MMQEKFSRKWFPLAGICLGALFVAQSLAADVIPSSSDPIVVTDGTPTPTPDPSVTPDPTPSTEPTPSSTPAPELSPTPSATPTIDSLINPSVSPSPTPVPPHALADQSMFLRVAGAIKADPRARSVFIPPVVAYGTEYVLVCASSNATIDVYQKGFANAIAKDTLAGDYSNSILVSGKTFEVTNILNAFNGIQITSNSGGIVGKHLFLRFVAISEPSLDVKLCNDGSSSNNRIVSVNSIGIGMDMKNANVRLKNQK